MITQTEISILQLLQQEKLVVCNTDKSFNFRQKSALCQSHIQYKVQNFKNNTIIFSVSSLFRSYSIMDSGFPKTRTFIDIMAGFKGQMSFLIPTNKVRSLQTKLLMPTGKNHPKFFTPFLSTHAAKMDLTSSMPPLQWHGQFLEH